MRHLASLATALLLAALLAACAGPTEPPSRWERVLADRFPRVDYLGGPVLRHPRITTITFQVDEPALVERLEAFGTFVTGSAWWRQAVEGYCVAPFDCIGDGSSAAPVRLADALQRVVSDLDVETILTRAEHRGQLGAIDRESLLVVYLPAGVRLRDAMYPEYCDGGPRGFHRTLRLGSDLVAYAVIPRCGGEAQLTATASQEILETATNPDPSSRGFSFRTDRADAGFTWAGVEPIDPCGLITMDGHTATESGFTVHRAWSNRSASLGRDPCVPAKDGGTYRALIPREPTLMIPPGATTAKVAVDAVSRPGERWSVHVSEIAVLGGDAQCLDVALDTSNVESGDTATLSITVRPGNAGTVCFVGLISSRGETSQLWPLPVRIA